MMRGTPSTTPRRTIRHRRRSFVANPPLVPQPITDEHITFREVVDQSRKDDYRRYQESISSSISLIELFLI